MLDDEGDAGAVGAPRFDVLMTEPTPSTDPGAVLFDVIALDTPEPRRLADFYAAVLGWEITGEDDDWVTVRPPGGARGRAIAFQLATEFTPPTWPDPAIPQQMHLDFYVRDIEAAEQRVLTLGARATGLPEDTALQFRVYRDPSGHPFCLCWDS